MREGPFLILVDEILKVLECQVIPNSELAKIVCAGNLGLEMHGVSQGDHCDQTLVS